MKYQFFTLPVKTPLLLLLLVIMQFINPLMAQDYKYADAWGNEGFTLLSSDKQAMQVNYSILDFALDPDDNKNTDIVNIRFADHFLPANPGMPNTPTANRYIAIPQNSKVNLKVIRSRFEIYENILLAPSFEIPWDTNNSPLKKIKDEIVYSTDAFFPGKTVNVSEIKQIRGVNVVVLNFSPFQYNPVTKQLKVYRDIEVEIDIEGGNGVLSDNRLRNQWWEPILQDHILNYSSLPEVNFHQNTSKRLEDGAEYLIICPNNDEFTQWADSIKKFRTEQGILTKVVTIAEVGGNNVNTLKNYFQDAMEWQIPPAAVLLLGDYGTDGNNSIISPVWDNYCVSDNIFADVDGDGMPEMIFARMTARNATELETMVTKFINYEKNPPINPNYYNHPITALGWQTERWFQICSETIGGFWKNELGKEPVRINEIYEGTPNASPWSTAQNTNTVVNYFGPNGLGYIPATPTSLGNWSGGTAEDIANAINAGAFMLQHRDHGNEVGWGEPSFTSEDVNSLTNTDLCFVMSVNCLTGKFNMNGECFTEKLHRYKYNGQNAGALGLLAASEVSYSFVNDTYVWGVYDYLWPEFLPDYGSQTESRGLLPAFGMAAGKFFLQASNWPSNAINKEATYNLFHHHGDAFLQLYSEVPQELTVIHNQNHVSGMDYFMVQVDEGANVAITKNGEIISTALSEGAALLLYTGVIETGEEIILTITKQNYYRYSKNIEVVTLNEPYCAAVSCDISDEAGNGNGVIDFGENILLSVGIANMGALIGENISVELNSNDEYFNIVDGDEVYGNILSLETIVIDNAFEIEVADNIPDDYNMILDFTITNGIELWTSTIMLLGNAPVLEIDEFSIDDSANGNGNNRFEPGEEAMLNLSVANNGHADVGNVLAELICDNEHITINQSTANYGEITVGEFKTMGYSIQASEEIPDGTLVDFELQISSDYGVLNTRNFQVLVGKYPVLILDVSLESQSGDEMKQALDELGIAYQYATNFQVDFTRFKSLFISLGVYLSNYQLNTSNGMKLQEFLNQGGSIYMEGRSTWFNDEQLPIHEMFKTDVVQQGWYNYDSIFGNNEVQTTGMLFEYDGSNPVNNYYLEPQDETIQLLGCNPSSSGCAVGYNGDDYKTIAVSIEFGALVDGASPSTKTELIKQLLQFLGVIESSVVTVENNVILQNITVFPNPTNGKISFNIDAEYKVIVSDNTGRIISQSWINENKSTIDLSAQKTGMYFINLVGKEIHSLKVIKE